MLGIAKQAETLIEDIGITSLPVRPREVCARISTPSYRVEYREIALPRSTLLGMAQPNLVTVNKNIANKGRKNFTGGHEIGHIVLHISNGRAQEFACDEGDIFYSSNADDFEKEADAFASALLLPRKLISTNFELDEFSWIDVFDLSRKCETSAIATAKRVVALSDSPVALILFKNKNFAQFQASRRFPFFIGRPIFPMDHQVCNGHTENLRKYAEWNDCDASDYCSADDAAGVKAEYSSIYIPPYDLTMTLIRVDEGE